MTEQELAALDLAVAKAEGYENARLNRAGDACLIRNAFPSVYRPRDPAEAMRLLEKYKLSVIWVALGESASWVATRSGDYNIKDDVLSRTHQATGETPCIAICKAVVALAVEKQT